MTFPFRMSLFAMSVVLCASLLPVAIEAQQVPRKAPQPELPSWHTGPWPPWLSEPTEDPDVRASIGTQLASVQLESRDIVFRGGGGGMGRAIVPAGENGFFVVGETPRSGEHQVWIMRFDSNLKLLWEKFYEGERRKVKARATTSGGVVIVVPRRARVLMLDSQGARGWEKTLGGSAEGVAVLPDSVVVIGGNQTESWIRRLDNAAGNEIWAITVGPQAGSTLAGYRLVPSAIATLDDGTIIVAGLAVNQPRNHFPIWLMKMDAAGRTVMGPTVIQSHFEPVMPTDLVALSDGDLALTGFARFPGQPPGGAPSGYIRAFAWVARVSAQGVVRWQDHWGPDKDFSSGVKAISLPDGQFMTALVSETSGTHLRRHGAFATPIAATQRGGPPAGFSGQHELGVTLDLLQHKDAGRNRLIGVGFVAGSGGSVLEPRPNLWLFSLPANELGIE